MEPSGPCGRHFTWRGVNATRPKRHTKAPRQCKRVPKNDDQNNKNDSICFGHLLLDVNGTISDQILAQMTPQVTHKLLSACSRGGLRDPKPTQWRTQTHLLNANICAYASSNSLIIGFIRNPLGYILWADFLHMSLTIHWFFSLHGTLWAAIC